MRDSNVLVTGASGFLGKHLLAELKSFGYDKIFTPTSTELDLRLYDDVFDYVRDNDIDVIVHLAADVGGIGYNQDYPAKLFESNMLMGLNVLRLARCASLKKIIVTGTICAYPKFTDVPFKEEDLWLGYPEETNAPYGVAKKALLVYGQALRQEYGANVVYLMPTNLVGEYDHFDLRNSHIIPALIQKLDIAIKRGESSVTLWGDGTPTREFLYAGDCAKGIRLALEKYDGVEPINLGTGVEVSILDVASLVAEKMGFTGVIEWDVSKPNGQPRRCVDITKAKELFGFVAETSLDTALDRTIEWYKSSHG